ncbi:hypothetical protein BJX99DRAFT_86890 [Aspergillus californicus]
MLSTVQSVLKLARHPQFCLFPHRQRLNSGFLAVRSSDSLGHDIFPWRLDYNLNNAACSYPEEFDKPWSSRRWFWPPISGLGQAGQTQAGGAQLDKRGIVSHHPIIECKHAGPHLSSEYQSGQCRTTFQRYRMFRACIPRSADIIRLTLDWLNTRHTTYL